jgi:hypothetical protein
MKRFLRAAGLMLCAFAMASVAAHAQQFQFPTSGWGAYAPAVIQCGSAFGVNANAVTDTPIYISSPSVLNGGGSYYIDKVIYSNASVSLSSAQAGIFTVVGATGVTIVSNGALSTLTAAALNAAGSAYSPSVAATTEAFNLPLLYLNVGTPQGSAATFDVRIYCRPMYGSAASPH